MQTLEQPMVALLNEGNVTVEECFARSPDRDTLGKITKWKIYPSARTSSYPRHWPARPRNHPDPVYGAIPA